MTKKMLIDAAHPEEVRVAVIDQGKVEDFDFESASRKPLRGNIYLARVTRVEPSLQAAFVEYGGNRHGFLAFNEIHPDYYQIPISDRQILQDAEAEQAALAAELELMQRGDEINDDGDIQMSASETGDDQPLAESSDDGVEENVDDDEDKDRDLEINHSDGDSAEDEEDEEEEEDADNGKDEKVGSKAQTNEPDDIEAPNDTSNAEDDAELEDKIASADDDDAKQEDDGAGDQVAGGEDGDDETGEKKSTARAAAKARADLFERYREAKRKHARLVRNYKIQEVIKRRQILLVQVVKEERGNKGAALTTYLSLAGRYCVLMPNTARGGGISRKIPSAADRRRLRRVVDSLDVPQGMGLIIRTAGAKRTKTEIKRDYDYLIRLWESIRTLTLKSIAPCLVYEEASLIKRAIRDLYDKDISKVHVEGETGYREAKDFMKMLMPSHAKNVQPYKEGAPIFLKYGVEAQLDGMYQPTVRLKSGGYIVIHQTEALVAIDVNSGRSTRERNIEQTALKTNIEAAQEAARQFRLRDLAGLIVIDFIDMEEPRNNRTVEKKFKDAIKADRARIQTSRISNFGLLEMSRQRRRSGIVDGTTHTCPTCSGAGAVRSHEMAALRILRAIEGEAVSGKVGRITVTTSLDASQYILNHSRDWLKRIEDDNGVEIEISADLSKAGDVYDLEKSGAPKDRTDKPAFIRADQSEIADMQVDEASDIDAAEDLSDASDDHRDEGGKKKRRRRRKRKDAPAHADDGVLLDADGASDADPLSDAEPTEAKDGDEEDEKPKRRRRRGRRGGRRNRRDKEDAGKVNADQAGAEENVQPAPSDSKEPETPEPNDGAYAEAAPAIEDETDEAVHAANGVEHGETLDHAPDADLADEPAQSAPTEEKPTRKGWWRRATGS